MDEDEFLELERLTDPLGPPSWEGSGDVTMKVTVNHVRVDGKVTQTVDFPSVSSWSARDVNEIGYIAKQAMGRETGDVVPAVPDRDWSPGVREFGRLMQFGAMPFSAYSGTIRELLDTSLDALAARNKESGTGGGVPTDAEVAVAAEHTRRVAAKSARVRDEIDELTLLNGLEFEPEDDNYRLRVAADQDAAPSSREAFMNMRLWHTEAKDPDWIKVVGSGGAWLTVTSVKMLKKLRDAPQGCCALWALSASSCVNQSVVLTERTADWVGASVMQMVKFLIGHNCNFRIYDSIGRPVMRRESDNKLCRFMVANGHVFAFSTCATLNPLELTSAAHDDGSKLQDFLNEKFKFRSSNSIEVREFYDGCAIRPPMYKSTTPLDFDVTIDLVKAYPSVLLDPTSRFPIFEGDEDIQEYDERSVPRDEISRTGFYLMRLSFMTHGERLIVARGGHMSWVYGDMVLRTWPNVATFPVSGEYVAMSEVRGSAITPDEGKKLQTIVYPYIKVEANTEPLPGSAPVTRAQKLNGLIRSYTYSAITRFSGVMEKQSSSSVKSSGVPAHELEFDYIKSRAQSRLDYEPNINRSYGPRFGESGVCTEGDSKNLAKSTLSYLTTYRTNSVWHKTARPAKLALYSYIAGRLVEGWREMVTKDPGAQIAVIWTDCISALTTADPTTYDCVESGVLGKFRIVSDRRAELRSGHATPADELDEIMAMAGRSNASFKAPVLENQRTPEMLPLVLGSLIPQVPSEMTLDAVVAAIKDGWVPRLAIYGPPGCGKTHGLVTRLMAALTGAGRVPVVVAEYAAHVARLNEMGVDTCTTSSFLRSTCDFSQLRNAMKNRVLIIEEVGLIKPCYLSMLESLHPGGVIIVGDPYQLSHCGNLTRLAGRFKARIVRMQMHNLDRYSGEPEMHAILNILIKAINEGDAKGESRYWPETVDGEEPLMAKIALLRSVGTVSDAFPGEDFMVAGYRHKYTDKFEGKVVFRGGRTVHSLQGATVHKNMLIVDWQNWSPRLLFTAISRAKGVRSVCLLTRLPTAEDIAWYASQN